MSLLNSNYLQQSLLLAGSISLYGGMAQAQTSKPAQADTPQGRAGVATLCIEKRSYVDPKTKTIVTPTIYIDAMPAEGIDTGYVEGNATAKKWEDFLNPTDPARKAWLDETDIPEQAKEAIDLVKRLDKDKNGIITPKEFEDGEQGKSAEDRKIDLAFLTSLRCDDLYFSEGALNKVDVDAFPEVIALKQDLGTTKTSLGNLEKTHTETLADLDAARIKSKKYMMATIGFGGGLGLLLGVGLAIALARKRGRKAAPAMPAVPVAAAPAAPAAPAAADPRVAPKPAVAPAPAAADPRVAGDVVDPAVAAALGLDPGSRSPVPAALPAAAASTAAITADNVIISGEHAAPVTELNFEVLRLQVALTYRHFLSQAAREALEAGRSLTGNFSSIIPTGADLIDNGFTGPVDKIVTKVVAKYEALRTSGELNDYWGPERERRSFVRGGAPQRVILEVGSAYITEEAAHSGSPFEGGVGDRVRSEAERRAGDTEFFERSMREMMRHPKTPAGKP